MSIAGILTISVSILAEILGYLILIRCLLSWLPVSKNNFIFNIIYSLTDPLLIPIKKILGSITGRYMMIDFSPIIAWLLLDYVMVPVLINLINFIFR